MLPKKQEKSGAEDTKVEVTNFFGGGERNRGEMLAQPECPKCLSSTDRGVSNSGGGGG